MKYHGDGQLNETKTIRPPLSLSGKTAPGKDHIASAVRVKLELLRDIIFKGPEL